MSILMSILMVLGCKASHQEERAQMLLHVKDSKSLKVKIHSFSEYKKSEAKCDFELSKTLVPKSCYKLRLSKEKNQVIDKACERASYIMKDEVSTTSLSPTCAGFVNKKNKDIRYSKEEESPEKYVLKANNQF